jgi:hypothetical protein
VYASKISSAAETVPGLSNIGTLIGPLALQFINSVVPILLEYITTFEVWDSAQTELKFLLFRVYLSNTLNTLILTLSYILLMDPFLLASYPSLRKSLELKINPTFSCRVDQAADGLFVLVAVTWAIQLVSFIASPLSMRLLAWIMGQPWVKYEFNIAMNMVKKFSFLGLVFVAFPFAPLTMIFVPFYMYIGFRFENYTLKHYYSKPKRPFRGQQASLLYAIFYLVTFVLVGLSVSCYFITTKTMAKNCDIQDRYVGLCAEADSLDSNDVCAVSKSSKYYSIWGAGGDYPAVVCLDACGPFVDERSGMAAFKDVVVGDSVLAVVWAAIFEVPYVPWFLTVCLAMWVAAGTNVLEVSKIASSSKERVLESQIQASEADRKRQERIITKLKSIEEDEDPEENKEEHVVAVPAPGAMAVGTFAEKEK